MRLELVEREEGAASTWEHEGIPANKAIKGFGGAVLFSVNPQRTMDALENILGFVRVDENEEYARFRSSGDIGNVVDVPVTRIPLGVGGSAQYTTLRGVPKILKSMRHGEGPYTNMATNQPQSATVNISMPSTSEKQAESCLRLQQIHRDLPKMNQLMHSERN